MRRTPEVYAWIDGDQEEWQLFDPVWGWFKLERTDLHGQCESHLSSPLTVRHERQADEAVSFA